MESSYIFMQISFSLAVAFQCMWYVFPCLIGEIS